MLELNQLHLTSGDILLSSSSWLALLVLSIELIAFNHIVKLIRVNKSTHLKHTTIQNLIGSALEGLNLDVKGAKYFGILDLLKIFVFMVSLVILYDNPLY